MKRPLVLVACEESQTVTKAMRAVGVLAWSCDVQDCSGGHPEWHIKGCALDALESEEWDLVIGHPPCTYLSTAANRVWHAPGRAEKRAEALEFFLKIANANCPRICVENPQGYPNTAYRKPDQTIHPWMFGDPEFKRTCLWLKGLPKLVPDTGAVPPERTERWSNGKLKAFTERIPECKDRKKIRSKTFPGIARAMAEQWGVPLLRGEL